MSNNHIQFGQVLARFEESNISHAVLPIAPKVSVIICDRGARVYGPFFDSGESMCWIPAAFASRANFGELVESGHWNIGGDRLWFGPEIQYMIQDRQDYWGTYKLPREMDPGNYTLHAHGGYVELAQNMVLSGYNTQPGHSDLHVSVRVGAASNPLINHPDHGELMDRVTFGGYRQVVDLEDQSGSALPTESWTLVQVNPGGRMIVPMSGKPFATDYYEPVNDFMATRPGRAEVAVTGANRFKIGFSATQVLGRIGYLRGEDGKGSLLVREFRNDPTATYFEEPDFMPGHRGDSVHIYNDDGGLGGFGEMEVRGRSIGRGTGRSSTTDEFTLWAFSGPLPAIEAVADTLLREAQPSEKVRASG